MNFAEVTSYVNGRILWNLVNGTANVTTRLLYASLLAPDASVSARMSRIVFCVTRFALGWCGIRMSNVNPVRELTFAAGHAAPSICEMAAT